MRWCCFSLHSCLAIYSWPDPQPAENFACTCQISVEINAKGRGQSSSHYIHVQLGLCRGVMWAHHSAFVGQWQSVRMPRCHLITWGYCQAHFQKRAVCEHTQDSCNYTYPQPCRLVTLMSAFYDAEKSQRISLKKKKKIFPSYSARSEPVTFGSWDGGGKAISLTCFRCLSSHAMIHHQKLPFLSTNIKGA